jgi:hypothetical protein
VIGRPQLRLKPDFGRTIQIQAGDHVITDADPLPDDLRQVINAINASS